MIIYSLLLILYRIFIRINLPDIESIIAAAGDIAVDKLKKEAGGSVLDKLKDNELTKAATGGMAKLQAVQGKLPGALKKAAGGGAGDLQVLCCCLFFFTKSRIENSKAQYLLDKHDFKSEAKIY